MVVCGVCPKGACIIHAGDSLPASGRAGAGLLSDGLASVFGADIGFPTNQPPIPQQPLRCGRDKSRPYKLSRLLGLMLSPTLQSLTNSTTSEELGLHTQAHGQRFAEELLDVFGVNRCKLPQRFDLFLARARLFSFTDDTFA